MALVAVTGCAHLLPAGLRATRRVERERKASIAQATRALDSLLSRSDWRGVGRLLTNGAIIITGRDRVLSGSAAAIAALTEVGEARLQRLSRSPTDTRLCADGWAETGTYQVEVLNNTGFSTRAGGYAAHWLTTPDGERIDRLILSDAQLSLNDVPCALYARSHERSVVVFAMPMTGVVLGNTRSALASAAGRTGWQAIDDVSGIPRLAARHADDPPAQPFGSSIGARARSGMIWLEVMTQLLPDATGGRYFNADLQSLVTTSAKTRQTAVLVSVQRGAVRVGAGPTLVQTSWKSWEEIVAAQYSPSGYPDLFAETRTTRVIGTTLQFAYSVDLPGTNVLDFVGQYRLAPGVESGPVSLFPGAKIVQNAAVLGATIGHAF